MKEFIILLLILGFALYGVYSALKNAVRSIYKLWCKYKIHKEVEITCSED